MFDNRSQRSVRLRSRLALVGLALALGLSAALGATVVATRPGSPDQAAANDAAGISDDAIVSVALLVPDDRLDPRVAALSLQGAGWERAVTRLDAALFARAENGRKLLGAQNRLEALSAESVEVTSLLRAVVAEADGLAARLTEVEEILAARALDRYVNFGSDPMLGLADPRDATDAARSVELGRRVDEVQFSTREDLLARQVATEGEQRHLLGRAVELSAEIGSTETVVADRLRSIGDLENEVLDATEAVRRTRWGATVPSTDLSVVALDAYLNAEDLLAETSSGCNLRWWMIAGVARIESRHGRFGGRTLRADGRVDRPIVGIALDGGPGVRAMVDTDDGVFDGDTVWDRAVGPLQFIPETWNRRGRDADGDGWADPQNMYDAAYSAGRYLCALGGNLDSRSALRSAYFGYNTSTQYVNDVIGHADRYAELSLAVPSVSGSTVPGPAGDGPPTVLGAASVVKTVENID